MVLRLWESLHRGYPVGQLMLWETNSSEFPMRALGKNQHALPQPAKYAVIDGQQRLTAIWLVLKGDIALRYNLESQQFFYGRPSENSIALDILSGRSIQDVIGRNFFFLKANDDQRDRFATALHSLNASFTSRTIPYQTIRYANYPTVVNIFKRVNQQGEPLSEAQIALAGISNQWSGVFRRTFDLLRRLNDTVGMDKVEDPDFIMRAWTAVHTSQHQIKYLAPEEGSRSKYVQLATQALYEQSWAKLERGVDGLIQLMRDRLGLTNFQFVKAYFPFVVVINYFAHRPDVGDDDKERLTKWLLMSLLQSRYSARALPNLREDIRATGADGGLHNLFSHRWEALNPEDFVLEESVLVNEGFRSSYITLLYILMRKMGAADWPLPKSDGSDPAANWLQRSKLAVGDPSVTWEFHHIFPDESFDGNRAALRNKLETVQDSGTDEEAYAVGNELKALEARITNVANLAFLSPQSNLAISNRLPSDYLPEICAQPGGEDLLRRQFVPLNRDLWRHEAYPAFCDARRRLIVQAAKDLLKL
ncbi:MAG: DUF262 domain-containing protein [Anaerolineae bacterium]|nr:DUF262 domain-containing protein [Anaerolineae bacterium]